MSPTTASLVLLACVFVVGAAQMHSLAESGGLITGLISCVTGWGFLATAPPTARALGLLSRRWRRRALRRRALPTWRERRAARRLERRLVEGAPVDIGSWRRVDLHRRTCTCRFGVEWVPATVTSMIPIFGGRLCPACLQHGAALRLVRRRGWRADLIREACP